MSEQRTPVDVFLSSQVSRRSTFDELIVTDYQVRPTLSSLVTPRPVPFRRHIRSPFTETILGSSPQT